MDREQDHRAGQRHEVTVYGRFRYNGRGYDVPLGDISPTGCRFFDRHGTLQPGTQISLSIDNMGPFPAIVRWRESGNVGVEFERELYGPVMEHIIAKGQG